VAFIEWAAEQTERLLAPLGRRWVHSQAVAGRAEAVGVALAPPDAEVLVAAAYLHLTTGPAGELMTPDERLGDVEARHGAESPVLIGLRRAWPELMEAVAVVEEYLGRARAGQPM